MSTTVVGLFIERTGYSSAWDCFERRRRVTAFLQGFLTSGNPQLQGRYCRARGEEYYAKALRGD